MYLIFELIDCFEINYILVDSLYYFISRGCERTYYLNYTLILFVHSSIGKRKVNTYKLFISFFVLWFAVAANNMRIGHLNVRSILADFAAFRNYFLDLQYELFCVSETWLNDQNKHLVDVNGFIYYHAGRVGRGGGVGIYVSTLYKAKCVHSCVNEHMEGLRISVSLGKTDFLIGCIYRPPKGNYTDFLESFEEIMTPLILKFDNVVCLGDFNIDMLETGNVSVCRFCEVLDTFNLKQIVTSPTRVTPISATLLDYILITASLNAENVGYSDMHGLSDHRLVYCTIIIPNDLTVSTKKTFRNFRSFNYDSFYSDLVNLPWFYIYDLSDINTKIEFFVETLLYLMEMHAPLQTVKSFRPKVPYITDTIKAMIVMRDAAFEKAKSSGTTTDWNYYRQLRNYTTSAIRREKKPTSLTNLKTNSLENFGLN